MAKKAIFKSLYVQVLVAIAHRRVRGPFLAANSAPT